MLPTWGKPFLKNNEITEIMIRTNIPGVLGNCHASGTEILNELGLEHIKTGKPIFLQISL